MTYRSDKAGYIDTELYMELCDGADVPLSNTELGVLAKITNTRGTYKGKFNTGTYEVEMRKAKMAVHITNNQWEIMGFLQWLEQTKRRNMYGL